MNEYEKAVLSAVVKGPGYVSWYKIEQRLSVTELSIREYLPNTLRKLSEQGLIQENPTASGAYQATPLGKAGIEAAFEDSGDDEQ